MFQICHHSKPSKQSGNLHRCPHLQSRNGSRLDFLSRVFGLSTVRIGTFKNTQHITTPTPWLAPTSDSSVGNRSPFSIVICNAMKVSSKQLATYGNLADCVWDRAAPSALHFLCETCWSLMLLLLFVAIPGLMSSHFQYNLDHFCLCLLEWTTNLIVRESRAYLSDVTLFDGWLLPSHA